MSPEPLLQVRDLTVRFETDEGLLTAVDHVSLDIPRGRAVGLVGESGCGKSVTAHSILRLAPRPPGRIESGRVLFRGRDLLQLPIEELRAVRGAQISMIFQEPMTALSPLHRVGEQLVETVLLHRDVSRKEAEKMALEWLARAGVPDPPERFHAYPFQLSGGLRQRVMIAMALILGPELVIADEPTTALDVTVQAQVLDLMVGMRRADSSLLLITHDMGVVWETCDDVVVMYASRIVERGPRDAVFRNPLHPYTEGLLRAVPRLDAPRRRPEAIPGQVPSLLTIPPGCHFADRCPYVMEQCRRERPPLFEFDDGGRCAACFLAGERAKSAATDSAGV